MYKYLFGPVPSRRLGMSLGIDLVPHKVCTLDCVYCECGATTKLTTERMEYIPYDKVVKELEHFFLNNPDPDYFTFSGSGEPTLNSRLGDILNFIKSQKPDIPVAILTNGTLLHLEDVREEIKEADLVLPSLDAATDTAFKKINRPHNKLNVDQYIKGLINFSKKFKGKIWLEILILPGYNDSHENLERLLEAFKEIKLDKIQLNTLDRPGCIDDIRSASLGELNDIRKFWEEKLRENNLQTEVEIISAAPDRKKILSYRNDIETTILETISRRPCTLKDLAKILGTHINEINKYLDVLDSEGKIESTRQERGLFYQLKR